MRPAAFDCKQNVRMREGWNDLSLT